MGLRLALRYAEQVSDVNIAYLARPCQFRNDETRCEADKQRFWGAARFAPEVIGATSAAIDAISESVISPRCAEQEIALTVVGYSGGGTLAALVAQHRRDVDGLVTLAANLDHDAWTTYHRVSPLTGSLSLLSSADRVVGIPQAHLRGTHDKIVPLAYHDRYLAMLKDWHDAFVIDLPLAHDDAWELHWLAEVCRTEPTLVPGC